MVKVHRFVSHWNKCTETLFRLASPEPNYNDVNAIQIKQLSLSDSSTVLTRSIKYYLHQRNHKNVKIRISSTPLPIISIPFNYEC